VGTTHTLTQVTVTEPNIGTTTNHTQIDMGHSQRTYGTVTYHIDIDKGLRQCNHSKEFSYTNMKSIYSGNNLFGNYPAQVTTGS